MTIITAVMRKLLTLAYGVLKSGRFFDPDLCEPLTSNTVSYFAGVFDGRRCAVKSAREGGSLLLTMAQMVTLRRSTS